MDIFKVKADRKFSNASQYLRGDLSGLSIKDVDLIDEAERIAGFIETSNLTPQKIALKAYSGGSKVGEEVVKAAIVKALKNHPEQFCDEFGNVIVEKIKAVFKYFGDDANSDNAIDSYSSIFPNIYAKDKEGRTFIPIEIRKEGIKRFYANLRLAKNFVSTDLVKIGSDYDKIGRTLTELAIDSTKDDSNNINIQSSVYMGKNQSLTRAITSEEIDSNIEDILEAKRKGKEIPSYKLTTAADGMDFIENIDTDDEEGLKKALIVDHKGALAIKEGVENVINQFVGFLKESENLTLVPTADGIEDWSVRNLITNEREEIKSAVKICRCAIEALNACMAAKDENGDKIYSGAMIKDLAKEYRNAIYTALKTLGIEDKDVVRHAVAAAFSKTKVTRYNPITKRWDYNSPEDISLEVKNHGSVRSLHLIFPKEFVVYYTGVEDLSLTVKYTDINPYIGDILTFEDGYAEWSYENDYTVYFMEVEEKYTGDAKVEKNGIRALLDIYAYTPVYAIFLDRLYKANLSTYRIENGDFKCEIPELQIIGFESEDEQKEKITSRPRTEKFLENKETKVVGFNHEILGTYEKGGQKLAAPVGKSILPVVGFVDINEAVVSEKSAVIFIK